MAVNSGIRIDRDNVTRSMTLYKTNVPLAVEDAMVDAILRGTRATARRIRSAKTKTGKIPYPSWRRGPGRERTGLMYDSFYDIMTGQISGSYRMTSTNGNFKIRFGFLPNMSPEYAVYQEFGTPTVPAMLAVQRGWNIIASSIFTDMAKRAEQGKNMAEAGKLYKRAARARIAE